PETAFRQIAALIEAGLIIQVADKNDNSDLSDCVFILARQYAEAAHKEASIKSWLTNKAKGEKPENNQEGTL
ncbi:hypothetical protein ACE2PP_005180, partial [Salmonella enterica]|nr:hypothetical protein [Salmonella enterica]